MKILYIESFRYDGNDKGMYLIKHLFEVAVEAGYTHILDQWQDIPYFYTIEEGIENSVKAINNNESYQPPIKYTEENLLKLERKNSIYE